MFETIIILSPWQILLAVIIDFVIGDPGSDWHPVRLTGNLAQALETYTRKRYGNTEIAGFITCIVILLAVCSVTGLLLLATSLIHPLIHWFTGIFIVYITIGGRDMLRHVKEVCKHLESGNLPSARHAVGQVVGRDTDELNKAGIIRATVESIAESIVDGVTAPLFFAFLLGPVGAVLYRCVNTLDSMFGYKNERYRKFGYIPARLDDLFNWLPARGTGFLIVGAAFILRNNSRSAWNILWRDHANHASPNAGWPEAAMAGALNVQLGGSSFYFGKLLSKPTLGDAKQDISTKHIRRALRLAAVSICLAVLLGAITLS